MSLRSRLLARPRRPRPAAGRGASPLVLLIVTRRCNTTRSGQRLRAQRTAAIAVRRPVPGRRARRAVPRARVCGDDTAQGRRGGRRAVRSHAAVLDKGGRVADEKGTTSLPPAELATEPTCDQGIASAKPCRSPGSRCKAARPGVARPSSSAPWTAMRSSASGQRSGPLLTSRCCTGATYSPLRRRPRRPVPSPACSRAPPRSRPATPAAGSPSTSRRPPGFPGPWCSTSPGPVPRRTTVDRRARPPAPRRGRCLARAACPLAHPADHGTDRAGGAGGAGPVRPSRRCRRRDRGAAPGWGVQPRHRRAAPNAAALEQSRDDLRESLDRIGEALVSTHDIYGLLGVALETALRPRRHAPRRLQGARGSLARAGEPGGGTGRVDAVAHRAEHG